MIPVRTSRGVLHVGRLTLRVALAADARPSPDLPGLEGEAWQTLCRLAGRTVDAAGAPVTTDQLLELDEADVLDLIRAAKEVDAKAESFRRGGEANDAGGATRGEGLGLESGGDSRPVPEGV